MNKILIALDFSESCDNAISYVKELIKDTSIVVDMIHIYSLPTTTLTNMPVHVAEKVLESSKEHVIQQLNEKMLLLPSKNQGEKFPVYGIYPSSDIVEKAKSIKADLIVMALRQKYSMIDRFIGTVTAHAMAKTAIPVLAIPNGSVFKKSCKVLFPTEQPYSKTLTDEMADLLERLFDYCALFDNPQINMVHINKGDGVDIVYNHKPMSDIKFIVSNANSVEQGIKNILVKKELDLIAIQKKTRSFWERLYHSSVTRKLLFQARLPILIIT